MLTGLMNVQVSQTTDGNYKGILSLSKQMAFAAKQACIGCANESQAAVIQTLKHDFHIRTTWLDPNQRYGIHVRFTQDKTDLSARVETGADWLVVHETGGIRTADEPGHHGPDPHITFPQIGGARPQITDLVASKVKAWRLLPNVSSLATRKGYRTGARPLKSKGKRAPKLIETPFFLNAAGTAIYERLPNHRLKLFYTVFKEVHVKKDSTVYEPTLLVVEARFGIIFNLFLEYGILTAK